MSKAKKMTRMKRTLPALPDDCHDPRVRSHNDPSVKNLRERINRLRSLCRYMDEIETLEEFEDSVFLNAQSEIANRLSELGGDYFDLIDPI